MSDELTGQHHTILLVDDLVGEQLVLEPTTPTTGPVPEGVETTCDECGEGPDDCLCVECSKRSCSWRGSEGYCPDCDTCEDHCTHWHCEGCERRYSEDSAPCSTCEKCTDRCCDCRFCESCENTYNNEHPWCRADSPHCRDCCECSESNVPFKHRPMNYFHAKLANERLKFKSQRLVGVEVEVQEVDSDIGMLLDTCRVWSHSVVEDGSLDAGGFEVTTSAAAGDYLPKMLNELARALNAADARVDHHCGLHVHVDCRDFTFYDMRKLVKLYKRIEPALFAMMPGSRRRSTYCRPCGDRFAYDLDSYKIPKDSKRHLLLNMTANVPDKTWHDQRDGKYGRYGSRYNALNLQSWLFRGTIECRLHTGTVNAHKLVSWALLWQAIVDRAYKLTEAEIDVLPLCNPYREFNDSHDLLLAIAPDDSVKSYVNERIEQYRTHGSLFPDEEE